MSGATAAALRRRLRGPPAYVLNGIAVGLGIGTIQLLFAVFADRHVAQLAVAGAVYASLADLPVRVERS